MDPDHLDLLAAHANQADAEAAWPAASWQALRRAGVPRWAVPAEYGGDGLGGPELFERYQLLASACLTTCFLLSQREAFVRRVRDGGNARLCEALLPPLAAGERFATVGISQLTTARQHVKPPVLARGEGGDWVLDGTIPWVTGACRADHLLTGGVLEDGRQVLLVLPTDLPGVSVGPPLDLMALRGSVTAAVRCERVRVPGEWLLAGPAEKVLQAGRGGAGGLDTSCLALGLSRAAVGYLEREADGRPPLVPGAGRFRERLERLRQELNDLACGGPPEAATALRSRVNALVLQSTQAALTAAKGTGFLRDHPAQRWARQALFFLVWSCPWPAAAATLAQLSGESADACGWAP